MKKFLIVVSVFIYFAVFQKANGQCTVSDITISNVRYNNGIGGNPCNITADVAFTATTNSGNKFVYFHIWKTSQYPSVMPTEYPCTPGGNQSVAKIPVKTINNNNTGNNPPSQQVAVLQDAFINYGFNVNNISGAGFSTAGLFTNYDPYDPSVTLNTGGSQIRKQNLSSGVDRIFIKDMSLSIPAYSCGSPLFVSAFLWATNSQDNKPQCWTCEVKFSFNDPSASGFVNCTFNNRTYNLTIQTQGPNTLGGTYDIYMDINNSGTFDQDDITEGIKATGTFSGLTSSSPVVRINQSYSFTQATSTKSLWAVINVTSGVANTYSLVSSLMGNTCSTLPIKLKNFDALKRTGKVMITWETEEEINNSGFEIQRRIGNGKYETVAFINSKAPNGNGNGYSYSFEDPANLPNGVSYYRLRQVDFDGKSFYSEVRAVRSNSKALFVTVYPNPSRGTTNIALPDGVGTIDASLEDFTGKLVQRWNSLNVRNLQLTNLKPGIYMLRINVRETGEQVVERILVQ